MDKDLISNNIINLRKNLGLSQQEMANKIGLSRTAYCNIENGVTTIINENIFKIAEETGDSVEEILLGYIPIKEGDSIILDELHKYKSKVLNLKTEVSQIENQLNDKIEMQKELIDSYKHTITYQRDIISLLQNKIKNLEKKIDEYLKNKKD